MRLSKLSLRSFVSRTEGTMYYMYIVFIESRGTLRMRVLNNSELVENYVNAQIFEVFYEG